MLDADNLMNHRRIGALCVVKGGDQVGVVSTGDLMAVPASEKQAHVKDPYQYLHGRA